MRVVTIVPRRGDGGERDRLWAWTRERWERLHPDWPIIEGASPPGPFNRSAAVNDAVAKAGDADVYVLIDADIAANPDAVRAAADMAHESQRIVMPYDERIHLNRTGTAKVLAGFTGSWRERRYVEAVYTGQDSCVVAVPRAVWETVGGFDPLFVGWYGEDTAFVLAAETLTGQPVVRLSAEVFHLHHARAKNATRAANAARLDRYKAARGNPDAMRALHATPTRIPRILHRSVPAETGDEVEGWWADFIALHPGWDCRTYREPIAPAAFPLTGDLFARCQNGAQKAGLIRLESLVTHGGFWIDSDVAPYRSFAPFLHCSAVAAWEDPNCIPDAILGAEPNHPAFVLALEKARGVIEGGGNAWSSGPGVTTEVLQGRDDVLVLPPGVWYQVHYLEKARLNDPPKPWEFARHMWSGSWLTPQQKRSQERRQRR